jgi:hypothetical protein
MVEADKNVIIEILNNCSTILSTQIDSFYSFLIILFEFSNVNFREVQVLICEKFIIKGIDLIDLIKKENFLMIFEFLEYFLILNRADIPI